MRMDAFSGMELVLQGREKEEATDVDRASSVMLQSTTNSFVEHERQSCWRQIYRYVSRRLIHNPSQFLHLPIRFLVLFVDATRRQILESTGVGQLFDSPFDYFELKKRFSI